MTRTAALLAASLGVVLLIGACSSVPRGAALQSETLSVDDSAEGQAADFQVARVTRATIASYAVWPGQNSGALPWINRVEQPATRIIAAGDTLRVTIWTTETEGLLTSAGQRAVTLPDARVATGGTIYLPYAGAIRVSGMSPESARDAIEAKMGEVMASVEVQLTVEEGRANTVSLIGGVATPGIYPMPDNDFTVLGLLASGGGVNPGLVNPQIRLHRDGRLFGTSVSALLDQPGLDTTLEGGDKISVEAEERYFLSLGAAQTEAQHIFPRDRVSALDALSIVGGVTDNRADPQGILILREYSSRALRNNGTGPTHSRVVFVVDLTTADGLFSAGRFDIQSGDLVYVTESPVNAANSLINVITSALGLGRALQF